MCCVCVSCGCVAYGSAGCVLMSECELCAVVSVSCVLWCLCVRLCAVCVCVFVICVAVCVVCELCAVCVCVV